MRRLIVNADDFGFTRDVNEGIVHAHRRGILTSTTLMANGGEFAHAVLLTKEHPMLDIGVHVALVGGRSLSRPGKALPASPYQLVFDRSLDIEREVDLQVKRVIDAGIRPTHLDTHKHTHLLPRVASAVAAAAKRYQVRWVRRPLPYVGFRSAQLLERAGQRMPDRLLGFRETGKLDLPALLRLLKTLPEGVSELMVHPGFCTEELTAAPTRLKQSRQVELEALTHPTTRDAVQQLGITLSGFGAL
jgi:predicted glycoside hydrolase/deacetylase ChbG (UPF0249 family)